MAKVRPFDASKTKEAIRLYKEGASIAELKERYHCYGNPIVSRLKAAGVYKGSQHKAAAAKPAQRREAAVATGKITVTNGITPKELVDTIARSVAAAAFGNARFTPEPMTRAEMFDKVQRGVQDSVKKMKIGFHA